MKAIKFLKVVEIMWAVIAALSSFEIYRLWHTDRQKAYMFGAFAGLAVFMFFFRRKTRMRYEQNAQRSSGNQ